MSNPGLQQLWFTRCPVPTATGLAYKLGWLEQEFAPDGIAVATLQEQPPAARWRATTMTTTCPS